MGGNKLVRERLHSGICFLEVLDRSNPLNPQTIPKQCVQGDMPHYPADRGNANAVKPGTSSPLSQFPKRTFPPLAYSLPKVHPGPPGEQCTHTLPSSFYRNGIYRSRQPTSIASRSSHDAPMPTVSALDVRKGSLTTEFPTCLWNHLEKNCAPGAS